MMSSREILEFITENENVTLSKLSQLMGIKRAQPLYDIRDGKIKAISANYADKILSVFPEYSRAWLITGEGQPFSKNESEESADEGVIMAKNVYSERFLSIIDEIGLSDAKIANRVDSLDKTLMSHIRTGRQGVSINVLSSFFEAFPNVNANYILTGKGPMFMEDEKSYPSDLEEENDNDMSLTYDELLRLYKTTVSRYERLFDNLKSQFSGLEQTIVKANKELDHALVEVRTVLEERKTA